MNGIVTLEGDKWKISWPDEHAVPMFFKEGARLIIETAPISDTLEVLGVKQPRKRTRARKGVTA